MSLTPPKLSVRMRNKIRLRNDLLETVLDLFNESGFSACTVDNIARHTGCAKATVYVYFPGGRDEIFCTLYDQISDELSSLAERSWASAETSHGRIMAITDTLLTLSTRPRRGKFYAQLNPLLIPVLQPVVGKASQLYVDMLSEELSKVTDSNMSALTTLLVGALREASLKVAKNPKKKAELLDGISILVESLFKSFSAGPSKDRSYLHDKTWNSRSRRK